MDIRVRATSVGSVKADALVLLVFEGADPRRTIAAAGKDHVGGWETLKARGAFKGRVGQTALLHAAPTGRIATVVLAGLGGPKAADAENLRRASAAGVRAARDAGARSVAVLLPSPTQPWLRADRAAQAVTEGAAVGLYVFEAHKSKPSKKVVDEVTVLAPRGEGARAEKGALRGRAVADGVCLARDLGNQPGNVATPAYLAEAAGRVAEEEGLNLQVLEESDMRRLGMGALLGVTQGSVQPAKLIVLTYEPKKRGKVDTVALVGKGLTFDSGGISIKPSPKMEDMKFDMCGGAAVIGTMKAVARLKVPVRVVGVVPASENMPGGASYKPGDILEAMNGTTIEVRNTDAEGRLILADALAWTTSKLKPKPKAVVDLATLTGACLVALGDQHAGLMGNDERLATRLADAGQASGDPLWRLPLNDGYRKQLESPYADVSNLGSPGAGTITAACFLEKFAGRVPWAHLDIAGMAWTEKRDGYLSKGATGFGVRVLCRMLGDWKS